MNVKELIEKLQTFDPEYEVKTWVDYDECGNGTIWKVMEGTWDNPDEEAVMIEFEFDGDC